jgi:hypothetical protein
MLFRIKRLSSPDEEEKPCKNAFRLTLPFLDIRKYSSIEEFDENRSELEGEWRTKGSNHSVVNGEYIARKLHDLNLWGIKINSLKELLTLQKEVGDIIIEDYELFPLVVRQKLSPEIIYPEYVIVIYDDYYE